MFKLYFYSDFEKLSDKELSEIINAMPQSVKENIARFFEKAKAKVAEKKSVEIEEVPEGAF